MDRRHIHAAPGYLPASRLGIEAGRAALDLLWWSGRAIRGGGHRLVWGKSDPLPGGGRHHCGCHGHEVVFCPPLYRCKG